MPSSAIALPAEVLYQVVALLFADHLDALVAGPHQLKYTPPSDPENAQSGDNTHAAAAPSPPSDEDEGERLDGVAALLRVTYQMRHVTLKVLADALGLAFDASGIGRLDRSPWEYIQPIRAAYAVATHSTTAELALHEAYPAASLLLPYQKMATLEQQWRRVLFNLGELRKQEDDCTQFETSVDTLVEQMEDALELPTAIPFHILREPMCRRLGGLLILRNHHLSFTTFVKVVELQLLDMNGPDAEPCDFADLLEALQDLKTSQTDLEDSQNEWTELYGPPLDEHTMNIDEMIPILDKLINLEVQDNESYTKCKELACNVRARLRVCKEKEKERDHRRPVLASGSGSE